MLELAVHAAACHLEVYSGIQAVVVAGHVDPSPPPSDADFARVLEGHQVLLDLRTNSPVRIDPEAGPLRRGSADALAPRRGQSDEPSAE